MTLSSPKELAVKMTRESWPYLDDRIAFSALGGIAEAAIRADREEIVKMVEELFNLHGQRSGWMAACDTIIDALKEK